MPATAHQPAHGKPLHPRRPVRALEERQSAWKAGIAGTVLVHVFLLLGLRLMPERIFELDGVSESRVENRVFEIEINADLLRPSAPPLEPPRFVEVNPAAPENPPDRAPFVGAQNQQVAQPEPTRDGTSDTPVVAGEQDTNSTAIVSGTAKEPAPPNLAEQLEQVFRPKAPDAAEPAEQVAEQPPARAVNAPPGAEQLFGAADGGTGSTITRLPPVPGAETGAEARPGTANGRSGSGGYFAGTPRIDRSRPQERPRLAESTVNARNTSTIKNEFGTKNIGLLAYNAKWSAYGEYMQRLIDAVQAQWERLLLRSSFYPTAGATVRVTFKLDAGGRVSEIVQVDGTGGELAKRLCVSSITERAPYGDWTEDMIAVLGREQELTFTFHYR